MTMESSKQMYNRPLLHADHMMALGLNFLHIATASYRISAGTAYQPNRTSSDRYKEDIFGEVFDQLRSFCILYLVLLEITIIFSIIMRGSLYYIPFLALMIIRYPVIPAREQNKNVSQAFTLVHYQSTGKTTCFGVFLPMGSS